MRQNQCLVEHQRQNVEQLRREASIKRIKVRFLIGSKSRNNIGMTVSLY